MNELSEAAYGLEFLRYLAGEADDPKAEEYGLKLEEAGGIRSLVISAVDNAHVPAEEFLEPPVRAEDYGVDPEQGKTVLDEVDRLCRVAFKRRSP